jgi:hypothetical protein
VQGGAGHTLLAARLTTPNPAPRHVTPPQVLEVGPVGQALRGSPPVAQLFAHTQKGEGFGGAAGLVDALQAAAGELPEALKVGPRAR